MRPDCVSVGVRTMRQQASGDLATRGSPTEPSFREQREPMLPIARVMPKAQSGSLLPECALHSRLEAYATVEGVSVRRAADYRGFLPKSPAGLTVVAGVFVGAADAGFWETPGVGVAAGRFALSFVITDSLKS